MGSSKKANCDNCGRWDEYQALWNEQHTSFRALCGLCFDLATSVKRSRRKPAERVETIYGSMTKRQHRAAMRRGSFMPD